MVAEPYEYRTEPFKHQREEFEAHWDDPVRAILWEQGTGKTKVQADTAARLYLEGKIDAVLIVAPSGVHRNWIEEELPKHLPLRVLQQARMFTYQTAKAASKQHQAEVKAVRQHRGLAVLAMSIDAIMTEAGRAAAWLMLRDRRVLYILDESPRIKTPGAKRTKRVLASAKYAPYRRILTGTPITNSPFDIYSQLLFLDPDIWKRNGISTFLGFKTTFGIWRKAYTQHGAEFDQLIGFQNLERLKEIVDSISTRVTKDEVLDLPPKLYSIRTFDMEPQQRRLYEELRDEYMTFLDSGEMITAPLAIVRLLRLQQVCCGYVPPDGDDEPIVEVCRDNPRLGLLQEIVDDLPHKAIIWARFRRDIDLICDRLGPDAVRYDGKTDDDERAEAIEKFQRGDAKFFVSNPATAREGLTLTAARTVIYYSNSFRLDDRLQSEDRAHRIGQEHPVNYIDLVAAGTVDRHIVRTLVRKLDIASQITGDAVREWL